jgi:hypothetical protein
MVCGLPIRPSRVEPSTSPPRLIAVTRLRNRALLVLAPLTAAFSGEPLALCRQELPGRDVVSGTWTTVGALRSWGYANPKPVVPLAHVFPSAAGDDQAAWCWTKDAPRTYTVWGARAQGRAQRATTQTGPTDDTPSGPPLKPP